MEVLRKTNGFMEKWIYLIIPLIMIAGITAGKGLTDWTGWTPFLFMLLTFISSLNADYRKFIKLFQKPILLFTFLIVMHLFIPFVVFRLTNIVFSSQPDLATGITLSTLLPLGVTSIFWVAYNKGNLESTLSLVSLDTILSPFIVPITFSLILGSHVSLNLESLIVSLVKLVLIPTFLGMLVGEWLKKKDNVVWFKPSAAVVGKVCLYFIVLLNAASIAGQLHLVKNNFTHILIVVFATMVFGYLVSYLIGKIFVTDIGTQIAIGYSGGIRNYTVGVVLAATFFKPIVGFPVLMAMLLQHPVALMFYYIFRWVHRREEVEKTYDSVSV